MSLEIREIPLNTVSIDKGMIIDNNNPIAVEQEEEEKNIKLQKIIMEWQHGPVLEYLLIIKNIYL